MTNDVKNCEEQQFSKTLNNSDDVTALEVKNKVLQGQEK